MSSAGIKSDDRVMCILHLRASKTLIPTAPDMNYVAVSEIVLVDGRRAAERLRNVRQFWGIRLDTLERRLRKVNCFPLCSHEK